MFQKATKAKSKLRLAIMAVSGAGKTFTSLSVASGIAEITGDKIALVDTERGSASKYADRFDFDVCELDDHSIDGYVTTINAAASAGYGILILDSLTHAWKDLLEEIDRIAKAKYKGNTWAAWSDGTPQQRKLVDAILNYPGHIIATMRCKTEWSHEERNGRKVPVKVGMAPEQGKGIEYEFDMLMEISPDHIATFSKDRTGKFQDKAIEKPGADVGRELASWLDDGVDMVQVFSDKLESAKTLDELVNVWNSIPTAFKADCAAVKDEKKAQLAPKTENEQ